MRKHNYLFAIGLAILLTVPSSHATKSGKIAGAADNNSVKIAQAVGDEFAAKMDHSVGFYSAPKAAQMQIVEGNLGISSVYGAWGYQGAKPVYNKGSIINTQLAYVNCIDADSSRIKWRAEAKAPYLTGKKQVFSAPALGSKNLYLCSGDGQLVCMDQNSGEIQYMYATDQPVSFQPALAKGKIFIGTTNGEVICIENGDADADGWTAWGGNAQHNK